MIGVVADCDEIRVAVSTLGKLVSRRTVRTMRRVAFARRVTEADPPIIRYSGLFNLVCT